MSDNRWEGFSDEELKLLELVISTSDEYGQSRYAVLDHLYSEVEDEIARRRAASARSHKTLSMEDVEAWLRRHRHRDVLSTYTVDWLASDLRRRPSLDPDHDHNRKD